MYDQSRLTIGMAHHNDADGVMFTVQNLRAHGAVEDVEYVVVDNSPHSPHGQRVRTFLEALGWREDPHDKRRNPLIKYVPLNEVVGTSAPRNRVFAEASAPLVLCMDCHVVLLPGALDSLQAWWDRQPADSGDMITGPIVHDDLSLLATHFNAVWRAEMWGVWGTAWECSCRRLGVRPMTGDECEPLRFSPLEGAAGSLSYVDLVAQTPVTICQRCGGPVPVERWDGHEVALRRHRYDCLACQSKPFEILGHGCGLFAMSRQAWVGFHPDARGFGGEELYVHEKVRRAGGRVLCHPALRWWHRFDKVGGVQYDLSDEGKVRNYVLEFLELGMDLALIRKHFVPRKMSQRDWDRLVEDPVNYEPLPTFTATAGPAAAELLAQVPAGDHNLDSIFEWCVGVPRDLQVHAARIRDAAAEHQHVTILAQRREWDVYVLAGRPSEVVSYTCERDELHDTLHRVISQTEVSRRAVRRIQRYTLHVEDPLSLPAIAETDALFIDGVHRPADLVATLDRLASRVRSQIVIQGDTEIVSLWAASTSAWLLSFTTRVQFGLSILSRSF